MVEATSGGKTSPVSRSKRKTQSFPHLRRSLDTRGLRVCREEGRLIAFVPSGTSLMKGAVAAQFSSLTLDQKSSKYFCKHPMIKLCRQRYLPCKSESLYDKSAKDKSANDTSAKPTVRMPTVRKGQQCEETRVRMSIVRIPAVRCDIGAKKVRQQCEWQQCENDTVPWHALPAKTRVLGSSKPLFSPYVTPSLTIT